MSDTVKSPAEKASNADPQPLTALLLIGVGREFERRVRAALAKQNLKPRQVYILDVLERQGGVGQRELGDILDVDHSLLVTLLNPLETDKLIERRRSTEDRRRHEVIITAAGKRVLKKGLSTIEGVQTELLQTLDKGAEAELQRSLREVRAGFAKGDAATDYSTDKNCVKRPD